MSASPARTWPGASWSSAGAHLTARETGLLAAIGRAALPWSAGPGGDPLDGRRSDRAGTAEPASDGLRRQRHAPGRCRARAGLSSLCRWGSSATTKTALDAALDRGLASADIVLLSGGTSKGSGDLSYRVLARRSPGIVVHGVALKPGKPICLGAVGTHAGGDPARDFRPRRSSRSMSSSPRSCGGWRAAARRRSREIEARMAVRCNSERGRTEYLLVAWCPAREAVGWRPTRWEKARARSPRSAGPTDSS